MRRRVPGLPEDTADSVIDVAFVGIGENGRFAFNDPRPISKRDMSSRRKSIMKKGFFIDLRAVECFLRPAGRRVGFPR